MSDVLRLIAGGLLALICSYIGLLIKRHYSERAKFYLELNDFLSYAGAELSFKKTPLPDIINGFTSSKKGITAKFLSQYLIALKRGDCAEKMLKETDIPHLKEAEKKEAVDLMRELGKTSLDEQLSLIRRASEAVKVKHTKCAEESKRLGSMYFKLAVLLGIALIIIFA